MGHNDLNKDVIEKYTVRINKLIYDLDKIGMLQGEAEDMLISNAYEIGRLFDDMQKNYSNIENPCKKCFARPSCKLYRYYISMEKGSSVLEFELKDFSKCKPKARQFFISHIKLWDIDILSDQGDIIILFNMFWC
jgi:hypothetical protein